MEQVKFQITNIKLQTNHNDPNSKFQTFYDSEEEKPNTFGALDICPVKFRLKADLNNAGDLTG
jgi:hypothetical protein